jgi:2-polyprenyl-3-methyl-5-hydroxy-6-metoxy-1,4-benzoquinol methylase
MGEWQTRLYESYVSTGQSVAAQAHELMPGQYPQYLRLIRRHLPQDRAIRIADLACGHGALLFCLKKLGYTRIEGVDVSSEQVALAHRLGMQEVRHGSLTDALRDRAGTYDVIFLMDILEHLDKQAVLDVLELARDALTDRGRLVMHVPNGAGIFGMRIRYGDFTHQTCFTPQSIRQVLRAAGFMLVDVHEDRPVIHGVKSLVRRVLWDLMTLRERLLLLAETGSGGHVLSQNMLVIADKRPDRAAAAAGLRSR